MGDKEVFATTPKVVTERRAIKGPPAPERLKVYARDGSVLEVFPVDAREIVAGGEYGYEPFAEAVSPPVAVSEPAVNPTASSPPARQAKSVKQPDARAKQPEVT